MESTGRKRTPTQRSRTHQHMPLKGRFVRVILTTGLSVTMIATGGFGTMPNPLSQEVAQVMSNALPAQIAGPINDVLQQAGSPPLPTPDEDYNGSSQSPDLFDQVVSIIQTGNIQPTSESSTATESASLTPIVSATVSITPTGSVTPTPTTSATSTLTPTSTPTPTLTLTPTMTRPATKTTTSTATPTFTKTNTATKTITVTPSKTFLPTWTPSPQPTSPPPTATPVCSVSGTTPITVTFINDTGLDLDLYWIDYSCVPTLYASLKSGGSVGVGTYVTHVWEFIDQSSSAVISTYIAGSNGDFVYAVPPSPTPPPTATPSPTDTSVPFLGFNVSAVNINGFTTSPVTITAGTTFFVQYFYGVFNDPCLGCITQLVTGLGSAGTQGTTCAYNGIPGAAPGVNGNENVTLTAPLTSGTYNIVVEYMWEVSCASALSFYGMGHNPAPPQTIGQIVVP